MVATGFTRAVPLGHQLVWIGLCLLGLFLLLFFFFGLFVVTFYHVYFFTLFVFSFFRLLFLGRRTLVEHELFRVVDNYRHWLLLLGFSFWHRVGVAIGLDFLQKIYLLSVLLTH